MSWVHFLSGLYRGVPLSSLLEIRVTHEGNCKKGVADRRFFPIGDPAAWRCLQELIEANLQLPSMVAFGVNPRKQKGGSDEDVACAVAVVADLDGNKSSLEGQKQRLGDLIKQVKPYAWVASGSAGHGHVYFKLETPEYDLERFRRVGKRLRKFLDTDPSEPPMKMMRLPGSLNWKTGTPSPVTAWLDEGAAASLEALDAALTKLGAPLVEVTERPQIEAEIDISDLSNNRVQQLWGRLSPALQERAWEALPNTNGLFLRRNRDMAVTRAFIGAGATDNEIAWFFKAIPEGLGDKWRQRGGDYLERTIAYARKHTLSPSRVGVLDVWPGEWGGRVKFRLEVRGGRYEGAELTHGVESRSSCWPWLFRSAGLDPVPPGESNKALGLLGREMSVELATREWAGNVDLQVRRFYPC